MNKGVHAALAAWTLFLRAYARECGGSECGAEVRTGQNKMRFYELD